LHGGSGPPGGTRRAAVARAARQRSPGVEIERLPRRKSAVEIDLQDLLDRSISVGRPEALLHGKVLHVRPTRCAGFFRNDDRRSRDGSCQRGLHESASLHVLSPSITYEGHRGNFFSARTFRTFRKLRTFPAGMSRVIARPKTCLAIALCKNSVSVCSPRACYR